MGKVRGRVAAAAVVSGLAVGGVLAAAPAQAAQEAATPMMLIVAVHTDDEMTLSHLWTSRPGVKKVFLWLDVTEKAPSKQLNPATGRPVRWEPGEYDPTRYRGGMDTGYYRGSVANINRLRVADPSLPSMAFDRPSRQFEEGGREVTTWIAGVNNGGGIKYGYQGRQVTPWATRAAINDVTLNPAKFGLPPHIVWTDLVAPNYYNRSGVGGDTCDLYANPWHKNANVGVDRYGYPQFTGRKMISMCRADSSRSKTSGRVSAAVRRVGYAPGGSIDTYFGWLYTGKPPKTGDKSGVFSELQYYMQGPASVGLKP